MHITYIGHATLLIRIGETTVLTDPNFDPALGRFLARVSAPGIAIGDLPQLDAILLTHAHADHLSFRSLAQLGDVPVYAPPAIARWLWRKGMTQAREFGPGDSIQIGEVTVWADKAIHAGHRYGIDRWRGQANMYLVATKYESIFFAGDTALSDHTPHLVRQYLNAYGRTLDVALLPIGYAPKWKIGFRRGHLTSADALVLFEQLGAKFFVPYHWGTFNHVTATAHDAINELRAHVETHPRGADVRILEPGESLHTERQDDGSVHGETSHA